MPYDVNDFPFESVAVTAITADTATPPPTAPNQLKLGDATFEPADTPGFPET